MSTPGTTIIIGPDVAHSDVLMDTSSIVISAHAKKQALQVHFHQALLDPLALQVHFHLALQVHFHLAPPAHLVLSHAPLSSALVHCS